MQGANSRAWVSGEEIQKGVTLNAAGCLPHQTLNFPPVPHILDFDKSRPDYLYSEVYLDARLPALSSLSPSPAPAASLLHSTVLANNSLLQDRLTVQQLFVLDFEPAILAFLSACSTAENQVDQLADEAIHLASGFLIAGFSNVIASLWSSNDEVCVEVAREFYRDLSISGGREIDVGDFAKSLHAAIKEIYSRYSQQPLLWAQYIHVGA